jgi:hypothetical protein
MCRRPPLGLRNFGGGGRNSFDTLYDKIICHAAVLSNTASLFLNQNLASLYPLASSFYKSPN